jgi:TPR repeat protein
VGARAAYETAAQHGSALGAFGLAETYDPNVLARRRILGLKPDPALARTWYEKAAKLGNAEASQRLKKLTKPPKAASLPKLASAPKPLSSSQAVSSGSEVLRAR